MRQDSHEQWHGHDLLDEGLQLLDRRHVDLAAHNTARNISFSRYFILNIRSTPKMSDSTKTLTAFSVLICIYSWSPLQQCKHCRDCCDYFPKCKQLNSPCIKSVVDNLSRQYQAGHEFPLAFHSNCVPMLHRF